MSNMKNPEMKKRQSSAHQLTSKISGPSLPFAKPPPKDPEEVYKIEWPNSITPKTSLDSIHPTVPPTTPHDRFSFSHAIAPIPTPFPKMDSFQIPYVRQVGIKAAIDILSEYFSCRDYKINPLQFWFLDVITDCLWKMQDDFQFPENYQKVITEWVLFVFDLIRDPQRNLSRKEFFQVFNEALTIAEEKVQAGCELLPTPTDLFVWVQNENDEEISFPESGQSSSASLTADGKSFVAVGIDESVEVFKLPKIEQKICPDEVFTETVGEEFIEDESICGCEEGSVDFYEPDTNIPGRFLSIYKSPSTSSSSSVITEENEVSRQPEPKFLWKRSSLSSETLKKVCSEVAMLVSSAQNEESGTSNVVEEWQQYVTDCSEKIKEMEKNTIVNTCALFAIKQFVYDYFYETFQYTIIKLCFITKFTSITETINTEWKIPKVLKEELKRPKEQKPKKQKPSKAKKGKAPGKKTKPKKDKKKKKPSKKDSKKSKKPKKDKKKKPTKEEKAELARLKREQEQREEELRVAEENRRLLFPLKEATDEEFFKSIFDHWVKPKEKGSVKGKKGKKKK